MEMINNVSREIKRGQIYWCELPKYDNQKSVQSGFRPVVIIQNDVGNKFSPVVQVVCLTTSQTKSKLPLHVPIDSSLYSNLNKDGLILCEQVLSISKDRILGYMDTLTDIDLYKVDRCIQQSLQLNQPNSKIEKEINGLVEDIVDIEKFATRWINRGDSILGLNNELRERTELINKFNSLCNKYMIKFYLIHDYKVFDRKLNMTIRENSKLVGAM